MITEKQLLEIRGYLDKSENPLFIFDDDPDGLSSFLLLYKHVKRGTWFPFSHKLRTANQLLGKVEEHNPDLVILLDMPVIDQAFVDMVDVPIVHIDHHPPINIRGDHYHYYNPRVNKDSDARPTTYWAYKVVEENLWIGMIGMISDWFIPEYTEQFSKDNPRLIDPHPEDPGKAFFETEVGRLAKIFAFCLKGKKEDSLKCIKALMKIESPYEILDQETPLGRLVYKHYDKLNRKYERQLNDALESPKGGKLFVYTYPSSEDSFSSLLSTEMIHRKPEYVIIIARVKEEDTVMSIRSRSIDIPPILEQALDGLQGYGGGHDKACGCKIKNEDFSEFINRFRELVEKST